MSLGDAFRASDPMMSGMNAIQNPSMQNFAQAGMNMMMPGSGMIMGKGGDNGPGAYYTGQMDPQSIAARNYVAKQVGNWTNAGKDTYNQELQQGRDQLTQAKLMENARLIGPHLSATNVRGLPGFLNGQGASNGQMMSGADRGTQYGSALEDAMKAGHSTTGEIENKIGAKGTPTGLANYNIPKRPAGIGINDILRPTSVIMQDAQNRANQQNQQASSGGGK